MRVSGSGWLRSRRCCVGVAVACVMVGGACTGEESSENESTRTSGPEEGKGPERKVKSPAHNGSVREEGGEGSVPRCDGEEPIETPPRPTREPGEERRIYVTCDADVGSPGLPVYGFAPNQDVAEDGLGPAIEVTLREWLSWDRGRDDSFGVVSSDGDVVPEVSVSVVEERVIVDFGKDLEDVVANFGSTASRRFVTELHSQVFQFSGVDRLEAMLAGSCEEFWSLFETGCRTMTREVPEL